MLALSSAARMLALSSAARMLALSSATMFIMPMAMYRPEYIIFDQLKVTADPKPV